MNGVDGRHLIGGRAVAGSGDGFQAVDPTTGQPFGPVFHDATAAEIESAGALAAAAAPSFAATSPAQRARLLRTIADGLSALGDALVTMVSAETALPAVRVQNERARTVLQLQQFAALLDDGSWVDARIDRGDPARQPQPKPDVRSMLVPLGPVAVFGASNFPLAYSVAGGDTASALAAGCPVLVKGHPAHPGSSELVGRVVMAAVAALGLPAGTFALLHGRSHESGAMLVRHPAIAAVGFTGSHQGGRALCDLAAARPQPIPVFAEMGSMNPVLVLPRALAARGAAIGEQIAASALLAMGQFCTSPGMVAWIEGAGDAALVASLASKLGAAAAGPSVHPSIRAGYERALQQVEALPVEVAARGAPGTAATALCPTLLAARASVVLQQPRLRSEIYGPAVLAVRCRDRGELSALVAAQGGHLTATVHGDGDDFGAFGDVVAMLQSKVGRLIANGVPTGVEVCAAMVHGGPWPAASDARFSAVGTTSIRRWVRPMCWQDWPRDALPLALRDDNPLRLRRMVDGRHELPAPAAN
ncbi:MAG: aldehyde dehydrogenase (NADP(+)) [Planctomycetes bacterium]|jgi:NADP-dependent aldehyde dehydrogenase|nr:aldehyde dehydrogenase (NADP(+)) [Planctomycetota bacterium]